MKAASGGYFTQAIEQFMEVWLKQAERKARASIGDRGQTRDSAEPIGPSSIDVTLVPIRRTQRHVIACATSLLGGEASDGTEAV